MGLLTPLAIRIGRIPWLPKVLPQIVWVDTHLQSATRGRLSLLDIAGLPNLMLTVAGRTSGVPRSTPLLCVPYAGTYLVAGSNFGGPEEPAWARNLQAALAGTMRIDGTTYDFRAREVTAPEREIVWEHMLRTWPNFAKYQMHTTRTIKVFQLSPVGTVGRPSGP
jgi:deazaflavin-dependent oxidoreductase (nitroreductase family)